MKHRSHQSTIADYRRYVIANYSRVDVVAVRGRGVKLWDADGRMYLDFFPGFGVLGLGHCPPLVSAALRRQAGLLHHVPNTIHNVLQGELAKLIATHSMGGKCFFCNSGAEAIEAAIKLARLATPPEKYKIITMENGFHGRTLGAVSATAQPKYHQGFGPIAEGFVYVPFNDLRAVEKAADAKTCAVMLEPIQGEGGVNIADKEYIRGLRKLCDRRGMLLVFDEVQTGMGRTGHWFAYQGYGVKPDILAMAKALGGGAAIGAIEARPEVAKHMVPGIHGSTFGGNPLACAAGAAVFETIVKDKLLARTRKLGRILMDRLRRMQKNSPWVREVRAVGLMAGIELQHPGAPVVDECRRRGLLINCTHGNVLRFYPPMNVEQKLMHRGLDILEEALAATPLPETGKKRN